MGMLKHTKENRDWTPKGWQKDNEVMYKKIGRELGCKFLIATGSRALGNHIETSDYDFVIVDEISKTMHYRSKKDEVEKLLNVRLDFIVNNRIYPSGGIMIEI